MKKFKAYGYPLKEISQREIRHRELARRSAAEGFVLLKNDGALPLTERKIALFGGGSRMTVKGGSGSGDVRERHSVTIEEGLRNAGFTFSTTWMDRFENKFKSDISAWEAEVDRAIKKYNHPAATMKMFIEIGNHPKPNPATIMVEDGDLDDAESAIYVLSRQAGEGRDRRTEKGDYLLSDIETESIKKLSAHYKKLILILNCGSVIDLSVLEQTRIDAVIFYAQGGMEGGNALADILTGKVTPSGKLTDTWAKRYEDYPCSDTFSYRNGNLEDEYYREGIYVGYRYFSSFGIKPRYPFGYGLSYTTFGYAVKEVALSGELFRLTAIVTNTGKCCGKEVLQLYVAKPKTRIHTEKLSLVAFAKTKELRPGERKEIVLSFNVKDMAVFDGSFILQRGEYGLYFGTSAEQNKPVAVIDVKKDITTERVDRAVNSKPTFEEFTSESASAEYSKDLPRFTIETVEPVSHTDSIRNISDKVRNVMEKLTVKQKIGLVVGGGYKLNGYIRVMGAAGRTNTNMLKAGIPNIIMSDGPAGLNVVPQSAFTKSGSPRYPEGLPEDWRWGWLRHIGRFLRGNPKKLTFAYRYATAFPSETCLAQSFDIKLMEEVGRAVGTEMKEFGISVWLAPGMNIHRNPLCGRNFEYYSEDPLVSGKMAAAITRGVQSIGGVGVCIKHFCCNNQEDNRTGVSSNLSERALREIYLRGFRIAVEDSKPWTIMSSYNRVNGRYVCNDNDLLTGILRNEWGFSGLVMSDWNATDQCSYSKAINAGNDLIMPGTKKVRKSLKKAFDSGELKAEALDDSASRILEMIFAGHTSKDFVKNRTMNSFEK